MPYNRIIIQCILLAIVSQNGDISAQIRAAERCNDYKTVARLHMGLIQKNGFSFGNGRAIVDALAREGQEELALRYARGWAIPTNHPGGTAVLADALIRNQYYSEAKSTLKKLAQVQPQDNAASSYLELLRQQAGRKRYALTWQLLPQSTRNLKPEWFAPPQNRANQRMIEFKLEGGKILARRTDEFGNELVQIEATQGSTLTATAVVEIWPFTVKEELSSLTSDIPESVKTFLLPSKGIDPNAPIASQFGNSLLKLPYKDRLRLIMEKANKQLVYGVGGIDGIDSSTAALTRGGGHCESLSMSIVAWMRAAGIPARMIRGHSAINGKEGVMKQHTIPEYYLPGLGWRDWDHLYPIFGSRDNFIRLGSYNSVPFDWHNPNIYFQWREFKPSSDPSKTPTVPLNGPYRYKLLSLSLE